jgi:cytochrome c2
MIRHAILVSALTAVVAAATSIAQAAEPDWRLGRVYYRMICTGCHNAQAGHSVAPGEKTKAEWTAYFTADAHDSSGKSNPKVSYFVSKAYRESVKDTNKAAAKFLTMPESDLLASVKAFTVYGAKDSDNPQSCQ